MVHTPGPHTPHRDTSPSAYSLTPTRVAPHPAWIAQAGPKARGLTELPEDDLEGEVEYLAFRPSVGDLAANVVLGATILWLPLSFAAIGRFTFVKYRLTDRRLTVRSEPPVGEQERTDVAFEDVEEVLTVGNLLWGDLLVKLKNGDKVELRSIDNFFEIKEYIMKKAEECRKDQVDKLSGSGSSSAAAKEPAKAKVKTSAPSRAKGQGF